MWGVLSKQGIGPNVSLTKITLAAAWRTDDRGATLEAAELSGGHCRKVQAVKCGQVWGLAHGNGQYNFLIISLR